MTFRSNQTILIFLMTNFFLFCKFFKKSELFSETKHICNNKEKKEKTGWSPNFIVRVKRRIYVISEIFTYVDTIFFLFFLHNAGTFSRLDFQIKNCNSLHTLHLFFDSGHCLEFTPVTSCGWPKKIVTSCEDFFSVSDPIVIPKTHRGRIEPNRKGLLFVDQYFFPCYDQ